MIAFFEAVWTNPLLFSSIIASLAASVVSGIVGSYVVVKRIAFISGGIAHSVLGGIGFALWLDRVKGVHWISPIYGALAAAVMSALIIGYIHIHYKQREDSAIAAVWSLGMATGVCFISQTPGFNVELTSFLIGNILWISSSDLLMLGILDGIVVLSVFLFHKKLLAICFDEEQARLQGLHVDALYLLLLVLIAVSTVLLMQVVGVILVITMLTIPATLANLFTTRLSLIMVIAVIFCMVFSFGGTALAYWLDWPAGATIALLASFTYLGAVVRNKGK